MAKGGDAMWKRYRVVWRFPGRLCGSVPTDRGLLEKWLTARAPERQSEGGLNLADLAAEAAGHIVQEEGQEFQSNGFEAVDGCLCMRTMTVRAHLKDCARAISRYLHAKETGRLSFESRVKDALYYPPEDFWIRILQDVDGNEKETFEPSGWITKPITVDVRGQKYSAIKRFAYVELAVLREAENDLTFAPVASSGDLIVGTAGAKLYDIYPSKVDRGYFVATMGRNQNPTKGFMKFDISETELIGEFVRSAGGDFHDRFGIRYVNHDKNP